MIAVLDLLHKVYVSPVYSTFAPHIRQIKLNTSLGYMYGNLLVG